MAREDAELAERARGRDFLHGLRELPTFGRHGLTSGAKRNASHEICRIGGTQAVAALACGTASIGKVDAIVGPGNAWVATAKREVFGRVRINAIAGPSELCVVATRDGGASVALLAADLLSQAEHDTLAMVRALSPDAGLLTEIVAKVVLKAAALLRPTIAQVSIRNFGVAVLTRSVQQTIDLAEWIAPKHLELVIPNSKQRASVFRSAEAIFCGPNTPEALGNYIAGPNHVLLTNGTARFFSPLGVADFAMRTNVIRVSKTRQTTLGPPTVRLKELEGLEEQVASVHRRLQGAD